MILTQVPVIPPDLRPLVPLDGGRFATSDLNDLYRRVINRNNRLKRLIELRAPDIIIRNEKRMLQEAVDALFDNGRRGRVITGANKRPLKSLADMLKGKQGRFRQNLLGKRVDYSGRSVIVVGPELKLHQCGLPKKMALELFKPFIYSRLDAKGLSTTVKQAKKLVEKEKPEVWDILDEVIREHPVLLNRAPTLHRLGIQAFEPVLIEGKAIQLHPLVCAAFNADFDGDQMAVHVPLSLEAQLEARVLMMSTNNILHPANGSPIIVPSPGHRARPLLPVAAARGRGRRMAAQAVLAKQELKKDPKKQNIVRGHYRAVSEVEHALHEKVVHLHAKIKFRWEGVDEKGKPIRAWFETTPGRVLLGNVLPRHHKVSFEAVNKLMTKREISNMIDTVYRHCGQKETVIFCDRIMALGFHHAFKAGISFGKDDMVVPEAKWKIVEQTRDLAKEFEQQYNDGLITQGEKYNKVVDAWSKCTEQIADEMMREISAVRKTAERPRGGGQLDLHDGAFRCARLAGADAPARRHARPDGQAVRRDHREPDHFQLQGRAVGARVLQLDPRRPQGTGRHRAENGELRLPHAPVGRRGAGLHHHDRRLRHVGRHQGACDHRCGPGRRLAGQPHSRPYHGRGRARSVQQQDRGEEEHASGGAAGRGDHAVAGVQELRIRSVLTCDTTSGVCGKCYGRDLARGTPVNMGEAVGVIAAQSIGEPGTQLTMRTFHIGGAAQISEQSFIESNFDGKIKIKNKNVVRNSDGDSVAMSRNLVIAVLDPDGTERAIHRVPYGARLAHRGRRQDQARPAHCRVGSLYASDPHRGRGHDRLRGPGRRSVDVGVRSTSSTGIAKRVVVDWRTSGRGQDLRPAMVIKGKDGKIAKLARGGEARYTLAVDAIISIDPGGKVKAGDVIARIPTESAKTRDITGGLPRVAELFEARRPKEAATIAEISGTVRFGRDYKNKRRVTIEPSEKGEEVREYLIPKGKHIHLQDGDVVEKGDFIVEGNPAPHDILAVKGVEDLAAYLVNEIQDVYRLQGVSINDKHIEVIVRQMLQKVEIDESGETELIQGEQIDKIELDEINEEGESRGQEAGDRAILSCSASPRRRCRPARSSPRPRSRRPRVCSPKPRSTARSTPWTGSRRTSSSAV